ncbi:MAG: aspartate aminotransferase family protein [Methylacidiphilales bacterium]|nr:aspartate aminotransferase family protein [Candidatus Methylacidiphilales bacterium]
MIPESRINKIKANENIRFIKQNPHSVALHTSAKHLWQGVPMHWMADWSTPVPLFVSNARGATFNDVDGHTLIDFCLGDTGSMFGHSPEPIANAIKDQANQGYTYMLPTEDAIIASNLLSKRFGLDYWQFTTTASDANRAVIRWAREITGRKLILCFDGCYHGIVEDTLVRYSAEAPHGTKMREGLIGQVYELSEYSRSIPFNDLTLLEDALRNRTIAAVITEPVMTNVGMVLPEPGFLHSLRSLTKQYGTLLIVDETHTISTGIGGCTSEWKLQPDFFTLGKPIAGGLPCGVYGVTQEISEKMNQIKNNKTHSTDGHGHSGMGTTLSANAFTLHLVKVNLEEVMTEKAYEDMKSKATVLANGITEVISRKSLPWCVTNIGSRTEFQFCSSPPKTGKEAISAFNDSLSQAIHLFLINRGILITPFHNMMLVCPETTAQDIQKLIDCFEQVTKELLHD